MPLMGINGYERREFTNTEFIKMQLSCAHLANIVGTPNYVRHVTPIRKCPRERGEYGIVPKSFFFGES